MKRICLFLSTIVVVILAANVYFYRNLYNNQVNFQKHILEGQTELISRDIDNLSSDLLNEMNYILLRDDVLEFFQNRDVQEVSIRKMGVFFLKYKNLVKDIALHDNQNNVFSISRDENDDLITDNYRSREQKSLIDTGKAEELPGETIFTIPVSGENGVIANIIVRADLLKYLEAVFAGYYIENTLWQSLVNKEGEMFFSNKSPELTVFSGLETMIAEDSGSGGSFLHSIETVDGQLKVISSFHPVKLLDKDMFIVFSQNAGIVVSHFSNNILIISIANVIILILIILFCLYLLRKERREKHKSGASETAMKAIVESLPAGILIKGSDNKIKMINSSALDILKIDKSEVVIGKDISEMFFLSDRYPVNSLTSGKTETGKFIYYDDDDNEIILYKTETFGIFDNEKVTVEALIDISSMERDRKNEALLGEAKTEFLRKVSHDIRNPLNGIINMAGSLESEIDGQQADKEKIKLIRECCDDILAVVNDITEFPGHNPEETVIDEIPFSPHSEISSVMEQLVEKSAETDVSIKYEISKTIPLKLIGDPVQLRHILKTLTDISLKHTKSGEINLSVGVKKQTEDTINLEFVLEDTGTVMSRELIKSIKENGNDAGLISTGNFPLRRTMHLITRMNGALEIESPRHTNKENNGRGTRICFSAEFYTCSSLQKKLNFEEKKSYKEIRILILAEQKEEGSMTGKAFGKLGMSCETTSFNDSTIEVIRNRMADPDSSYSIIVIHDSKENDGFLISHQLVRHNLHMHFLIILISRAHKPGNFMKCRQHGIDHYLVEPFGSSEIFDIIQSNFSHIAVPENTVNSPDASMPELKILVAEDNHINKLVAQSLFRKLGYEIDLASDGREAIEKIKETDYDIIFMDIRMPKKNGLDAAYEIRRLGYKMPVVAMTANSGDSEKAQALEVGMDDFISKPVTLEVLRNILLKRFPGHPD